MEVFGEPEKDGKLVPDDVSGFKFITFRAFTKGAQYLKLELITRGQGTNLESGYSCGERSHVSRLQYLQTKARHFQPARLGDAIGS